MAQGRAALARDYTVVCADLRGYGDSSKPRGVPGHANYSKRAMALDMVEVMAALGFVQFHLVGHDRGGRVAHRLARDHGKRVRTLTVLDISPTLKMYESTNMQFAKAYYHWFFLIQEAPLPEKMLKGVGPGYILSGSAGENRASRSSTSARSPSISAASIRIPRARTTARPRRLTSSTTAKAEQRSRCRCSRCGAGRA